VADRGDLGVMTQAGEFGGYGTASVGFISSFLGFGRQTIAFAKMLEQEWQGFVPPKGFE